MFLIDDLLLSPIAGFKFIMRTLVRTAEEQWNDDTPLKERLMELQVLLEEGQIDEEEYSREEAEVLRAIREIQNRRLAEAGMEREEQGLSGSGVTGTVEASFSYGATPAGSMVDEAASEPVAVVPVEPPEPVRKRTRAKAKKGTSLRKAR